MAAAHALAINSGNFMILFAVWKCLRTPPNRFFHEKYPNYKRNLSRLLPSPSVPAPSEREPLAKPKSLTERVRREKQLSSTTPFREKGFWKNPQIFPEPYKDIFPLKMARVKRRPFKLQNQIRMQMSPVQQIGRASCRERV